MKKWILCQEFEALGRHDQRSQSRKLWRTCVLWFDSLELNVCLWCNKSYSNCASKKLFCVQQKAVYPNQWSCHWCIHIWVRRSNIYGKVRDKSFQDIHWSSNNMEALCWWQLLQNKVNQSRSAFNSFEFATSKNQTHHRNPWKWNACVLRCLLQCRTRWSNQNYYTERKHAQTNSLISKQVIIWNKNYT